MFALAAWILPAVGRSCGLGGGGRRVARERPDGADAEQQHGGQHGRDEGLDALGEGFGFLHFGALLLIIFTPLAGECPLWATAHGDVLAPMSTMEQITWSADGFVKEPFW